MLRIATIGTSAITEKFLNANKLARVFNHTLVFSRNRETAQEFALKVGCAHICTNLEKMAKREDFDAVYIASPNALHYSQSRLFLKGGKHVLCEKTITSSAREYKKLKRLARRKGLVYMEAMMSVNSEGFKHLVSAVAECGKINGAVIDFSQRSSRLDDFLAGKHCNIFDMSLKAGALMDLGIYSVYMAVALFGVPQRIKADSQLLSNGADSSGKAIFRYKDFDCTVKYSKTADALKPSKIEGEKASVLIDSVSQCAGISFENKEKHEIFPIPSRSEIMAGEIKNFAMFINGENLDEYKKLGGLALNVQRCMDKIKKSAKLKYPKIKR